MRVAHLTDLGQYTARGAGSMGGGRNGPMAYSQQNTNVWENNDSLMGLDDLNQEEIMRVTTDMNDLGQTTGRGSGHHQGGRSGPPSLVYGNQDIFGLGKMMPGSEGATGQSSESLFGLGQEAMFGLGQLLEPKTAKTVRNLGNFAAAAGGATFAFLAIKKGNDQTANIALGALGGGLAIMALLSLGMTFGKVSLD